jgi:hypothetical protein
VFMRHKGRWVLVSTTDGVARPGLSQPTILVLREAFNETMRDPALLDEVRRSAVDIDPLPGSDVLRTIEASSISPGCARPSAQAEPTAIDDRARRLCSGDKKARTRPLARDDRLSTAGGRGIALFSRGQ